MMTTDAWAAEFGITIDKAVASLAALNRAISSWRRKDRLYVLAWKRGHGRTMAARRVWGWVE